MKTIALLALTLLGCIDTSEEVELSETENTLYTLSTAVWPTRQIPVCFEFSAAGSTTARAEVRAAIEGSWERVADVDFTGWSWCLDSPPGIHIAFHDVNPHVKELGTGIDGMFEGMVLNDSYNLWSPVCQQMKSFCNRSIAIHEFGHALGFAHEHNRDDRTADCTDAHQGTDGDTNTTTYDPDSVMNYCADMTDKLSMNDVVGVQRVYGPKPTRSLVAFGGNCVVAGANGYLATAPCEAKGEHRWSYVASSGHLVSGIQGASRCATAITSAALYHAGCVNAEAQKLSFAGVELRGYGDRCIGLPTVIYGNDQRGTNLETYSCNGSDRQKWTYMTNRELRNWEQNLCFSVEGGKAVRGAKIELAACNGSAVQRWTFSGGLLRSDASVSQCVRFHTGTGDTILYDCDSLSAERDFRLAGPVSRGGMCLQLNPGTTESISLAACDGSARQTFDYRF